MPNLTATLLDDIRMQLEDVFTQDRQTNITRLNPPLTLKTLAEQQTARFADLPDGDGFEQGSVDGKTCVGRKIEYLVSEDTALPTIDTTPQALACDITSINGVQSNVELYAANLFTTRKFIVNSKDCDNTQKMTKKINHNMLDAHAVIATALNNSTISTLQSSSQIVAAGNTEGGTVVGTTLQFAPSNFDIDQSANMSIISKFETIAAREAMGANFMILDGGNMNTAISQSVYNSQNDDQRAANARLVNGHVISQDLRNMDAVTGNKSTFLVDPSMYAFYSIKHYEDQANNLGDDKNTMVYSMPLVWFDLFGRAQNLMYATGDGRTEMAYVNVRVQKTCATNSTQLIGQKMDWLFEVTFAGMFDLAPTENKPQIINIVNV